MLVIEVSPIGRQRLYATGLDQEGARRVAQNMTALYPDNQYLVMVAPDLGEDATLADLIAAVGILP